MQTDKKKVLMHDEMLRAPLRTKWRKYGPVEAQGLVPLTEQEQGAMLAISVLIALHDQPGMAADVLVELGLHAADCTELDEYDKQNLKKIQGERGGSIRLRGL